jgi:hypothetical protein
MLTSEDWRRAEWEAGSWEREWLDLYDLERDPNEPVFLVVIEKGVERCVGVMTQAAFDAFVEERDG